MTRHDVEAQRTTTPLLRLDLSEGGRAVGWIRGRIVGFRGFASETDAGVAAWVAYGTAARRLARGTSGGAIPVDVAPLSFSHVDGRERILASGREIGTLLRPEAGSQSGSDSFGFEIEIPAPADELRMRSMAHLIYRTLRRSGARWAAPVPGVAEAKPSVPLVRKGRRERTFRHGGMIMYNPTSMRYRGMNTPIGVSASLPPPTSSPSGATFVSRFLLISMGIVSTIALMVMSPPSVTGPLGFVFLAGLFGTFVLSTLERRRQRRDERHRQGPGDATGSDGSGGTTAHDADSGRGPSASAALAVFSISMLGIALLAPVPVGIVVAVVALAGLVALRISAMFSGWAPRGSAWAGPRPGRLIRAVG